MAGEYLIKRYGVKLDDGDEEFDLSKRDKKPMIIQSSHLNWWERFEYQKASAESAEDGRL